MPVDELSSIVPITKAQTIGKKMVHKLKDIIPRQMVQISVQASMGGKILARENIKPYRKDVTAKLVSNISVSNKNFKFHVFSMEAMLQEE